MPIIRKHSQKAALTLKQGWQAGAASTHIANNDSADDFKKLGEDEHMKVVSNSTPKTEPAFEDTQYRVTRLTLKPGEELQTKLHFHRKTHWVVVEGTARITVADDSYLLSESASTFIDIAKPYAVENPGKIPLRIIAVECGTIISDADTQIAN